ncbi:MAG: mechanosensitive ion channel family protein [Chryseolinea sp.]
MEISHWTGLIYKKLERWLAAFIKLLPNVLIAIVILVAAYFVAKVIKKISYKLTLRISKSDSISSVVSVILQTVAMIFAITVALGVLNLDTAVSSLLAGVGIVGLALGFAFQDLSSNFISGLYMAFRRPFEIGDKVETNSFIGTIKEIELRSTTLTTTAGLHVIIPNKDIFQKPIINYSRSGSRRVELDFTLLDSTDLVFAESVIRQAIESMSTNSPIDDIEFYYTGIEDPKIKLTVSFKIDDAEPKGFLAHRHQAIVAIYKALGDNNIIKVTATAENATKPQEVG